MNSEIYEQENERLRNDGFFDKIRNTKIDGSPNINIYGVFEDGVGQIFSTVSKPEAVDFFKFAIKDRKFNKAFELRITNRKTTTKIKTFYPEGMVDQFLMWD